MEIYLVVGLIAAIISGVVAGGKHRNVPAWGILGFFFPLIALIAVCCLPPLPEQPALPR